MSGKKGEHEPEKEGVLATIWDYAKTFLIIFLVVFALNKTGLYQCGDSV